MDPLYILYYLNSTLGITSIERESELGWVALQLNYFEELYVKCEFSCMFLVADQQEKFRQLQQDATRRENVLVMRLTDKDQELQELVVRIPFNYV